MRAAVSQARERLTPRGVRATTSYRFGNLAACRLSPPKLKTTTRARSRRPLTRPDIYMRSSWRYTPPMSSQADLLWGCLNLVAEKGAAGAYRSPDGKDEAPAGWSRDAARLEHHVFAVFLFSHVLVCRRHDQTAWNTNVNYFISRIRSAFPTVAVEGGDFDCFVDARLAVYGSASLKARREGMADKELSYWIDLLTNFVKSCRSDSPISLHTPIVITDAWSSTLLKADLQMSLQYYYIPLWIGPMSYICDRENNLSALPRLRVEQLFLEGVKACRST